MGRRLPILTFHSLDESGSPLSISPTQFRTQMEHLRADGWQTLSVEQLVDGHGLGEWPARSLVLTFDDGFQNLAEHGVPVLRDLGFTAIVFVVVGWVGKTNDWPGQPRWVPRSPLLDWDGLGIIAGEGIEIGAHTMSHPRLASLDEEAGKREVLDGKRILEDHLGCPVRSFAYPYGDCTGMQEELVATHFQAGFSTRLGFATATDHAAAFHRIDMFYLRNPRFFRAIETGWLNRYLLLRRWIRDLRNGQR